MNKIDKILKDNPDLSEDFVRKILIAEEQVKNGETEPYVFGYIE